jgi:hypothetical protein
LAFNASFHPKVHGTQLDTTHFAYGINKRGRATHLQRLAAKRRRSMKYMTAFDDPCSPGVVPLKASFRADFDATARVLLIRVAGRFSDDSMAALYAVWRKLSAATGAKMGIADLSLICEFDPSVQGIRNLANQPGMTELRIMVAPQTYAYGVLRMFQGLSERSRPLLQIVHTIEEAFSALGIRSPQFAPWLTPALPQIQAAIS